MMDHATVFLLCSWPLPSFLRLRRWGRQQRPEFRCRFTDGARAAFFRRAQRGRVVKLQELEVLIIGCTSHTDPLTLLVRGS